MGDYGLTGTEFSTWFTGSKAATSEAPIFVWVNGDLHTITEAEVDEDGCLILQASSVVRARGPK